VADAIPALCAGGLLMAIGVSMAWFQWRFRQPDAGAEELARLHARRQLRRRLQVSALMVLVGALIPIGDLLPQFQQGKAPLAFALFWMAILAAVAWIMLLAVADLVSARMYHKVANLRIRQERRELERQLDHYRAGGNGRQPNGHQD
jgi:hypothetical protein